MNSHIKRQSSIMQNRDYFCTNLIFHFMGKAGFQASISGELEKVWSGGGGRMVFYNQCRNDKIINVCISSVLSLSRVWLVETLWIAAHQASLPITNSQSSLKLTCIELAMPSSHLILCCTLLFLPSIPPSIRVFSNESTLCMRWPKYWSFSFSIIPSKEH